MAEETSDDQVLLTLRKAIECVLYVHTAEQYHHAPGTKFSTAEAQQWLDAFSSSPRAWAIAFSCIGGKDVSIEVQQFCGTIILKKVRTEWGRLPAPERQSIVQGFCSRFYDMAVKGKERVVLRRFSQVLAASSARSDKQFGVELMSHAFSWMDAHHMRGDVLYAVLILLTSFAEEADHLDKAQMVGAVGIATVVSKQALGIMQNSLEWTDPGIRETGVECLREWLKFHEKGQSIISLSLLASTAPSLLEKVSNLIAIGGDTTLAPLFEIFELLVFGEEMEVSSGMVGEAMWDLARVLLLYRKRLAAAHQDSEEVLDAVVRVAVAIVERHPSIACGFEVPVAREKVALEMAEMVLQCAAHPVASYGAAESMAEYFMELNTIPLCRRHPQLQTSVYAEVLRVSILKIRYPEGFVSWDDDPGEAAAAVDEEDFERFRNQHMRELFGEGFNVLREGFLVICSQAIENGNASWQMAEAGLFALRCAAGDIKNAINRFEKVPGGGGLQQEQQGGAIAFHQYLHSMFGRLICNVSGQTPCIMPCVSKTYALLFGAFAWWFEACKDISPLEGALAFCLRSQSAAGGASLEGAKAFSLLCSRCASKLAATSTIDSGAVGDYANSGSGSIEKLIQAAGGALLLDSNNTGIAHSTAEIEADNRKMIIMEGLARLISSVESPGRAATLAKKLMGPLLDRIRTLAGQIHTKAEGGGGGGGGGGGPDIRPPPQTLSFLAAAIGDTMTLLGCGFKFLTLQLYEGKHPTMNMLEEAWPLFQQLIAVPLLKNEIRIVEGLCEVCRGTLLGAREAAAPLVPVAVQILVPFCESMDASCVLDTFKTIAEIFGSAESPDIRRALEESFVFGANGALATISTRGLRECDNLTRALLEMCHTCLLLAPTVILGSSQLPVLIDLSIAAGSAREIEVTRSALFFLLFVVNPIGKMVKQPIWIQHFPAIKNKLESKGPELVWMICVGLAETAPRSLHRKLSGLFYALRDLFPVATVDWVKVAVMRHDFPARDSLASFGEMFFKILMLTPPLERGRFDAFMGDFALICRGEGTVDTLLGYAM